MTLNSDELRAYQQAAANHNDPSGRLLQLIHTHVTEGEDAALEQMTEVELALYEVHLARAKTRIRIVREPPEALRGTHQ
jgi:hypothetical protein